MADVAEFQLSLLDMIAQTVEPQGDYTTLEERFWAFHAANPTVYNLLRSLALDLKRRGRERYGIGGLFEVLRWQYAFHTTGEEFKLSNNHRAFYARLLMEREAELDGFFVLRPQRHKFSLEDDE